MENYIEIDEYVMWNGAWGGWRMAEGEGAKRGR